MNARLRQRLDLVFALAGQEFALMEQGTLLGFILSLANNILMLLVFHLLFVPNFLQSVEHPWLYLLLGIVHWNLFMNMSLGGFSCLVYRQKLVMGYRFPRQLLVFARIGAVFLPYFLELALILVLAGAFAGTLGKNLLWLPLFLAAEYAFAVGIGFAFAYLGVLHKNILPFWNILFRLLSFATPIFYVPEHFASSAVRAVYYANPFTLFMLWGREIAGAPGAPLPVHPLWIVLIALGICGAGFVLFRRLQHRIGDHL